MGPRARGIDVNGYHPVKNWVKLMGSGISFLGIKVSAGSSIVDDAFIAHRDGARDQNLKYVIYYHYATSGDPNVHPVAKDQSNRLQNLVGPLKPNEVLCLDIEAYHTRDGHILYPTPDPKDTVEWADEFMGEVLGDACSDRHPLIYTSDHVWQEIGNPPWDLASDLGLWVPRYDKLGREPALPRPWATKGWDFWQQTDGTVIPLSCPGVGICDGNVFKGDDAMLAAYAVGGGAAAQPVV